MVLRPITAQEANALVRRVHYSGKVVNNSQLHIGAFLNGKLEGALQFGPSLDKRKIQGLVSGTGWNEFIELNRMAFTDALPRNSESRAIAIAMKLLRKHAPHIKWVVTFADGTQCGDGTIYRAAGFVLTSIKPNNQIWEMPSGYTFPRLVATNNNSGSGRDAGLRHVLNDGEAHPRFSRMSLTDGRSKKEQAKARTLSRGDATKGGHITETGAASMRPYIEAGARPIPGFQLRYLYFLDPSCRDRLTVPILPFSEIERRGAGMYRGESRAGSVDSDTPAIHAGEDGAVPIPALHDDTAHTSKVTHHDPS